MIWHRSLERQLSLCLIAILVLPVGATASTIDQPATAMAGQQAGQSRDVAVQETGAGGLQPVPSNFPTSLQQSPQATQPTSQAPTPLGTAAAPEIRVDGAPASTPSGAAIAPAKQKRVFRFSVKTALIVGAVVAAGVVAGASLASPGRP